LHIAQQMPLPLTVSCSNKSRLVLIFLVLPFWYLLTRVYVCVCFELKGQREGSQGDDEKVDTTVEECKPLLLP